MNYPSFLICPSCHRTLRYDDDDKLFHHKELPCLVCRAQSKTRYLHHHPSRAASLLDERYTWEQEDLYDRPLDFELAMFATEEHFFDPLISDAHKHYIKVHVPSYLRCRQVCDDECDVELGGCATCSEHMMLSHVVGHDEFNAWIVMVCTQLGMCLGCGGFHDQPEQ